MQLTTTIKFVCCVASGVLAAVGAWVILDPSYDARVSFTPSPSSTEVNDGLQKALSRKSLTKLINQYDLYPADRLHMPMEDVIEGMRKNIAIYPGPTGDPELGFHYQDRNAAQKVAPQLATLLEVPTSILSTKTAPDKAHWMFLIFGLAGGLFAGLLMASSGRRLIGWSLLGAIAGLAGSLLIPEAYVATAPIRVAGPFKADLLAQQISQFQFLPFQEVRNHLRFIRPLSPKIQIAQIAYTDGDPDVARRVVKWVMERPEYDPGPRFGVDPAAQPDGPNRPVFAGAGSLLGALAWVTFALRQRFRRAPLPTQPVSSVAPA